MVEFQYVFSAEQREHYFTRLLDMAGSGDPRAETATARHYLAGG